MLLRLIEKATGKAGGPADEVAGELVATGHRLVGLIAEERAAAAESEASAAAPSIEPAGRHDP